MQKPFQESRFNMLERVTGAHVGITSDHALIHQGIAYTVANKMDVAAAKVGALQLTIPAGVYCHFKPAAFSATGGPVVISLLEDYSFAGGNAIIPVNRRRVGTPDISAITVKGSTDITAVAGAAPVTLDMSVIPGSTVGADLGGSTQAAEEWVLKPGATYLVTISNVTSPGATVTVGYELFWYEEGGA